MHQTKGLKTLARERFLREQAAQERARLAENRRRLQLVAKVTLDKPAKASD
jgi:hypothetical protein